MINGQFAQIGEFERKTEQYKFSASISLNQESILMRTSTQLVVRPQLYVNGRSVDVKMLKNVKLAITTLNYIDKVPLVKNFSSLKFNNDAELTVQF